MTSVKSNYRSAPDLANGNKDGQLRKTKSQPQPARANNSVPQVIPGKTQVQEDAHKHSRCKSVPTPLSEVSNQNKADSAGAGPRQGGREISCPNSPTDRIRISDTDKNSKKPMNLTSLISNELASDPTRPKKMLFEGFRYTLRKSKDDSAVGGIESSYANSNEGETDPSVQGNETQSTKTNGAETLENEQNALIESGTLIIGRVLFTYNAVREDEISVLKNENVHVLGTNQHNMLLIHRPANESSPAAEGLVPIYVVGAKDTDGSFRRNTWQLFKNRISPSMTMSDRYEWNGISSFESRSKTLPLAKDLKSNKMHSQDFMYEMSPSVHTPLTSLTIQAGGVAEFTCRICGRPRPSITWKFNNNIPVRPDARTVMSYREDGVVTLQISHLTSADSGEYTCIANSDIGGVITKAMLTVLDRPDPPSKPLIKTQVGTSVHLEWLPPQSGLECGVIQGYTVEFNELGLEYWQAGIPYVPNTSQVIGDLNPGSTYQFRVRANNTIGMSDPSISSNYVTIPTESELSEKEDTNYTTWKTTYENDFIEVEEIERGRFSLVKKCTQKCSSQNFAAKCLKKHTARKDEVETEYNTLQSLQHPGLVQAFDLYETQDSLIMITQLVPAGRLFDFISSSVQFDEIQGGDYARQLLETVHYLHNCRIAHLDIKPENLLVEISASNVNIKLVDFGDARHIYNNFYVHATNNNPEFLAPEIVAGTPVGLLSDIWSVGVIVYVMLSGVSPFLDESEEETCSNIIRNDYCFPEEFFVGISEDAKDFIRAILVEDLGKRPTAQWCLDNQWIKRCSSVRTMQPRPRPIATGRLAHFVDRRKHLMLTSS